MSGRLARGWAAWVALWDRREDAAALALVRIAVGLVLVYDFVAIWRHDAIAGVFAAAPDGYGLVTGGWAARWLGTDASAAHALWAIALGAAICLATGTLTRVACVVFVLVSAQLSAISPNGERGIDSMLRIVILILACSRCHARWSVDAWVRRRIGKPLAPEVPAWPRYLLLLQLVWVYFSGGCNKGGAAWFPWGGFTALANVMTDPHVARFDPGWVPTALPLTRVATAVTMLFELGAPIYLWLYHVAAQPAPDGRLRRLATRLRLRWVWIAIGAGFHLGIAIFMRLGIFPWGMLALYPVLLRPDEVARVVQRLKIWAPANRASSPS